MLKENREEFLKGKLDKYEYMERMFDIHKFLYEYADFIKGSDIYQISIKNGEVYYTFLNNGVEIKMTALPYDMTSVPLTFVNFGSYEEENKLVLDLVKDGDTVVDAGANLGWYTLNWLNKLKNVEIFSFEPMPETYKKLIQNIELNGHKSDKAFNYGLSSTNEEVDFFWDTERCGASSMVNLRDTDVTQNIKCAVKKLDDVFHSIGAQKVDFIKCDVEGAEKLVLDGGIKTIKKFQPIIFCEMLRKWAKKFDYHPTDTIKMLALLGYNCYAISRDKLLLIDEVTDGTEETNFLFLHKIKHAYILPKNG